MQTLPITSSQYQQPMTSSFQTPPLQYIQPPQTTEFGYTESSMMTPQQQYPYNQYNSGITLTGYIMMFLCIISIVLSIFGAMNGQGGIIGIGVVIGLIVLCYWYYFTHPSYGMYNNMNGMMNQMPGMSGMMPNMMSNMMPNMMPRIL
ncbi:MAG: hypothetical protein Gaeavirus4_16 [Gaeavirus sp.]|uniref:Uncharacterized protein n=1 Tax=Gaeavirus sp. TaxID=2487767 RepID=A0A3G5A2C8_9VIRU|nr:MAG: hypothetical protein Gaeavirus4_16 [Gaeavirus sp.]